MKIFVQSFAFVFFFLLSIATVIPLLSSGYLLTFDMVSVPRIVWPSITSSSFLFESLYQILNHFLPAGLFQKITIFFIFFLSGWGMYRLISKEWGMVGLYGGLFYAVNPFVYERIMAGQWNLLLGYSIFPLAIEATLSLFHYPNRKDTIILAVISILLTSISLHFMFIFACFFIIFTVVSLVLGYKNISPLYKYLFLLLGLIIIFNANWMIPSLLERSEVSQKIQTYDNNDLIAFQSVSNGNFGLIFNLLSGYGFWPEVYHYFISAKEINIFWPFFSLLFILLSLYGCFQLIKLKQKSVMPLAISLVILFFIALDFAGGIGLKPFANTVFFLYEKLPFLRGFREPQKLVGVIMFCFAYFSSFGLLKLRNTVNKKLKNIVLGAFLIIPLVYTPTVFNGFWNQLKPVSYPQAWFNVNNILKKDKADFLTLFFPWHQYLPFRFSNNRIVTNPAAVFFNKQVLSSRNYETEFLYTHDDRPEVLHVEGLLSIEREGVNLLGEKVEEKPSWGESLAPIGVKYLILAKDDDWKDYSFIINSPDLEKAYEDNDMILYRNLKWTADYGSLPVIDSAPIDN